jgi:hypothetical protein
MLSAGKKFALVYGNAPAALKLIMAGMSARKGLNMKKILLIAALCLPMFSGFADAAEETKPTALSEAEQLLIDSIKGVRTVAGQTMDFAKEQVPDVIHQLIVWNMASSALWSFLGLLIVAFGILMIYVGIKNDDDGPVVLFLGVTPAIIGVCMFFSNLLDVIKIWLAPKVWLLEYAASLLKGTS